MKPRIYFKSKAENRATADWQVVAGGAPSTFNAIEIKGRRLPEQIIDGTYTVVQSVGNLIKTGKVPGSVRIGSDYSRIDAKFTKRRR